MPSVRVVVCIATYRRPVLLRALMQSLAELERPPGCELAVVVVDNDSGESARPVLKGLEKDFPWNLVYAVEPVRNISMARNTGVKLALKLEADFLAFIDDDEIAAPGWMAALLSAQMRFGADVVSGAVLARYPSGAPEWVRRGRFFEHPRRPTGSLLPYAHTNNVLIARSLVDGVEAPFDPSFGRTGGGDSHFFMRARRSGARLVWVDEAVVEELVPLSRTNAGWILRRAFRIGNAGAWCERSLAAHPLWFLPRLVIASGRFLQGLLLLLPQSLRGRAGAVRALLKVAYGAGCLSAMAGYRYQEYRAVHGE